GGERPTDATVAEFSFDPQSLDSLFTELTPAAAPTPPSGAPRNSDSSPFAMATDFLSKGLYDRASAEISRAMSRGNRRADGLALHGEALERYREALELDQDLRAARFGEAWSLVRLGRPAEARPLAVALVAERSEDVDGLMLLATACAESGDPAPALSTLEAARRVEPMRAEIHQKIGDITRSLGDNEGAIAAYRHALELDQDFAVVRFQLALLLQGKGQQREAEAELVAALDAVPTYAEAALELAMLRRRLNRPAESVPLLIDLLQR